MGLLPTLQAGRPSCVRLLLWSLAMACPAVPMTAHP
jgi:hypothetical protein